MLFRRSFLSLIGAVALTSPMAAQGHNGTSLEFRVRGGGYSSLTNFNNSGFDDTKLGFNAGGGVGLTLSRYVSLRTDFTYARSERRTGAVETGDHLDRFFYTAAAQVQYPTASGVTPYVLVGAGGVTVHEEGTSGLNTTKVAGVGGLGLSYAIPGSRFAIFSEGLGYLYKVRGFRGGLAGFDKTQFDVAWSAGLSYAIGF